MVFMVNQFKINLVHMGEKKKGKRLKIELLTMV